MVENILSPYYLSKTGPMGVGDTRLSIDNVTVDSECLEVYS